MMNGIQASLDELHPTYFKVQTWIQPEGRV